MAIILIYASADGRGLKEFYDKLQQTIDKQTKMILGFPHDSKRL
jgi:hypothetical protein